MSAPQAAAITACTACAAVGGAAAGGAFSSGTQETTASEEQRIQEPTTPVEDTNAQNQPITFKFLAGEITSQSSDYGTTKIGKKYENYLVGVYGDNKVGNKAWWDKSFEKYQAFQNKTELASEFQKDLITKGFAPETGDAEAGKALNKVCEVVFKKEHTATLGDSAADKEKYKKSLWKFCSDLGEVPKSVTDSNDSYTLTGNDTPIGASTNNKSKLLSTKAAENEKLWKWKNDEFFKKGTGDVTEKFFKKLYDDKTTKASVDSALKDRCEEAYKLKSEDDNSADTKVSETATVKYCSLDGQ